MRNEGRDVDPRYAGPANRSFRLLRVVESLRAAGQADQIRAVYLEFGRHFHHDDRWDDAVRASTREVGPDLSTVHV